MSALGRERAGRAHGGAVARPLSIYNGGGGDSSLVLPLPILWGKALDDDVTTLTLLEELPEEGGEVADGDVSDAHLVLALPGLQVGYFARLGIAIQ